MSHAVDALATSFAAVFTSSVTFTHTSDSASNASNIFCRLSHDISSQADGTSHVGGTSHAGGISHEGTSQTGGTSHAGGTTGDGVASHHAGTHTSAASFSKSAVAGEASGAGATGTASGVGVGVGGITPGLSPIYIPKSLSNGCGISNHFR